MFLLYKLLLTAAWILVIVPIPKTLASEKKGNGDQNPKGKGDADTKIFPFKEYEEFQISSGKAGKALESAEKVFVKPFEGMNLKEVPKKDFENMEKMALLAVENENLFNTALEKAKKGKDKKLFVELQRGKTANKVLKLVGTLQVIKIQIVQGVNNDFEERRADYEKK
ncbi:hypothetical protein BY996DRAFT_6426113 [Phakopsora pachyrhizi]|nr:hypothetical protein BY996DRAFT_6426113 [Phakopsora pachyrhizi]